MNKLKLSVVTLASVILMACSGGGGSKNNDSPQQAGKSNATNTAAETAKSNVAENQTNNSSATQSNSAASTGNQQSTPKTYLENTDHVIDKNNFQKGELTRKSITYGNTKVAELSGYNRKYSFNGALIKVEEANITEIAVDGSVKLLVNGVAGTIGGLGGPALSKTLGAFYNATKNPVRDVFYFGDETPVSNIPKRGVVTYKGNASRYDNVGRSVDNVGNSELIADFAKKTIKGELDMTYPRRNIALHETAIVGNGFKGKAVAEGNFPFFLTQDGRYEGRFYGPNAEEVAGKAVFENGVKDLNTSFSAEKIQ